MSHRDGVKRKHKGLDIVCKDGSTIYAPFDVTLTGKAVPYKYDNAINDGVAMKGEGLHCEIFFMESNAAAVLMIALFVKCLQNHNLTIISYFTVCALFQDFASSSSMLSPSSTKEV